MNIMTFSEYCQINEGLFRKIKDKFRGAKLKWLNELKKQLKSPLAKKHLSETEKWYNQFLKDEDRTAKNKAKEYQLKQIVKDYEKTKNRELKEVKLLINEL